MAARFEPNSLMDAAETQIMQIEYARSLREPPWDGILRSHSRAIDPDILKAVQMGRLGDHKHQHCSKCQSRMIFNQSDDSKEMLLSGPWVIGPGYCGLVQTCEEECLSSSGFRWSSGSGNAMYGSSPKYNPFGTPGECSSSLFLAGNGFRLSSIRKRCPKLE